MRDEEDRRQRLFQRIKLLEAVLSVARRFVPDDRVIQWEQRELDLRSAIHAYDSLAQAKETT
jgi:hypothetical protein